jgi:hypothetical protein
MGTDLRRAMAPPTPAKAGGAAPSWSRPHHWMSSPREDVDRTLWRGRGGGGRLVAAPDPRCCQRGTEAVGRVRRTEVVRWSVNYGGDGGWWPASCGRERRGSEELELGGEWGLGNVVSRDPWVKKIAEPFFIKQEEAFGIVGQFVLSRPTATRHPDDRMSWPQYFRKLINDPFL